MAPRSRDTGKDDARRPGRLASGGIIRDAAARLFLERGYAGTSMDDIAAAANVSKQTIYTHFANKEALFSQLVLANAERVNEFAKSIPTIVGSARDTEQGLRALAGAYLGLVIRPEVLQLRRLVIGEAGRFPELARRYYEGVPQQVYAALASLFKAMMDKAQLRASDPRAAAHHFAWLVIGLPMDRGIFNEGDAMSARELDRAAAEGVRVFLAAYARAKN